MTFQLPNPPLETPHPAHDRLAIAALAAGDARGADRERATDLVQGCEQCRILFDDLRSLAAAVRVLPMASSPPDRDFRLSSADAARLSRGGWLRRLLRPVGSARGSRLQPAAGALVALGLAVFVLSGPSVLQFGTTGAAPSEAAFGPAYTTSTPDPASSGIKNLDGGGIDTSGGAPGVVEITPQATSGDDSRESPVPPASLETGADRIPWPFIGLLLAATGLALLIIRRVALRLR